MAKILHIDDDIELGDMLCQYLQGEGFEAEHCPSPVEGLKKLEAGSYNLVILDVMMPEQSGLDTLKAIRAKMNIPVIMLTAKGDNIDRIIGLELGSDDYVPKPCMPREIVARVRAVLRRISEPANPNQSLELGPLVVNPGKRKVILDGQDIDLTSAEFNLLTLLVRQAGQVVSKETLSEEGLGKKLERFDRSVDVHLSNIRNKLGLSGESPSALVLHTIRGKGYQLSLV
ncbi:response regulator transcription factor [Limnobacter litoralis]|uniref:DNA-binding response regulator n=1 Tax=Limnobacter litoralis TaxID=481366 RepID=A0ABQ5YMS1_9BURK|nr:response regulator transcription factor [Limnobacter litoralis]GLR25394.1 DNA-binding response regulator [Limnobacter litoralis]